MNAFVKKEIRLLLPSFLIGCVLTLANLFFQHGGGDWFNSVWYFLSFVFCPAVAVMIALNSFGAEVSSGTFAMLLAQPVSRLKIWQTKILLLALSFLAVGFLWCASFVLRCKFFGNDTDFKNPVDVLTGIFMFGLAVFSGGLWTVLLLRQVAAAFWFTLLVPGVILMILVGFFSGDSDNFLEGLIVSILGLYSLAGFFFARWLFFRAQDVQWSGGTIAMPEMRGLPAWFSKSSVKRIFRPRAALWRKEFQLHQAQFIMAFALLLLHLGARATRTLGHFQKNSSTEFILEAFWGLWLVMPLLVGCAAVAEERKLGTLEGQLCLPVKRRTQFAIKFFVALFLSVLLGAVMPLLLEGTKILPNVHSNFGPITSILDLHGVTNWQLRMSTAQIFFWNCLGELNNFLPLLTLAGIAAAFGVISLYVSSLTRNTLQSLAPAVLGILIGFFGLTLISQMQQFELDFLWRGPLPFFIGVPAMLLTLLALAFWNFKHVQTGWKMWRRNLFMFVLALVFYVAATSAIYHRAWEKLTPFEPAHGAARLSQANPVSLNAQGGGISVRLPDGKIWMNYFMTDPNYFNPISMLLGNVKFSMVDGKFIGGSNWLTVQYSHLELIGLKTDGSLWISEGQLKSSLQNGKRTVNRDKMLQLAPFGNETNWNSFASIASSALLVKNDGTLWRWGAANWNWKKEWPGLRTFTPYRLGTESNWAKIYENDYHSSQMFLRKTDGSVWTFDSNNWNTNGETLLKIAPGFTLQSVKNLECDRFRSTAQILSYKVGVRDDGTFRIWADERRNTSKNPRNGSYEWFPADLQIGDGTNWIAVAGDGEKIVALKNDGTLWLWNFYHDNRRGWDTEVGEREMLETKPVRLGTHADWIAISGGWGNVTALAADGSLWFWPLERPDYYYNNNGSGNDSHFEPLLDISRKPQPLGNIFGKAD